jgi:hypothetical protein
MLAFQEIGCVGCVFCARRYDDLAEAEERFFRDEPNRIMRATESSTGLTQVRQGSGDLHVAELGAGLFRGQHAWDAMQHRGRKDRG